MPDFCGVSEKFKPILAFAGPISRKVYKSAYQGSDLIQAERGQKDEGDKERKYVSALAFPYSEEQYPANAVDQA